MNGRLTSHVLDQVRGAPATGMMVDLWRVVSQHRTLLRSCETNADGRVELLGDREFLVGTYEIVLHAADYFTRFEGGAAASESLFQEIIIRVKIARPDEHYHVPVLIAPWSYCTYRGS
ncbi:5-hydroxyisourate hydrolase 2 [Alicyclobacillus cellulosilyticus]|uniref:5-hydroxyisourate hydrolase n=1 Tax=Alicyclobacillus cellulosilyticus TaxID=1003997 RepID=A0A917KDY3_9BACL|nr:hydroxyisourate hydrolase [Alicyclobacillus cellulosilyticus]GGJ10679.1 5-hydroxyisourate hydrolase 2 [Alicyclobacillus cellulosilyticus]